MELWVFKCEMFLSYISEKEGYFVKNTCCLIYTFILEKGRAGNSDQRVLGAGVWLERGEWEVSAPVCPLFSTSLAATT